MTIPNFKSQHDWEAFTTRFDSRWYCKKALLDRVKDDLFPGYSWDQLQGSTLETINEMVQAILCDMEFERFIVDKEIVRTEISTDPEIVRTEIENCQN